MNKNNLAAFTITLLTCQSCIVVPVSVPSPTPVTLEDVLKEEIKNTFKDEIESTQLEPGLEKTCYADALPRNEGEKITASSESLETAADKLATAGKHKEAIRKYNEAAAATMNEAVADGSIENMEIDSFFYKKDEIEAFKEEHRPIIQKSAESNFKIGSSYARIGEYEKAIDCFNGTLKIGILPPNDATAYLNRGDAYEKMGATDKAKADFQQAVNLFKKHKLPAYQKLSEKRLQILSQK